MSASTAVAAVLLATLQSAGAQAPEAQGPYELWEVQAAARAHDPRVTQFGLQDSVLTVQQARLGTSRLPNLAVLGESSWASEVTEFSLGIPGASPPVPPRDRYEAALQVDWMLWDGGLTAARQLAATAQHDVQVALVDQALFDLRTEVNEAFFQVILLQSRLDQSRLLAQAVDARRAQAAAGVAAGTALPMDTALLRAELLRIRQEEAALEAERAAVLRTLDRLTGLHFGPDARLVLPELGEAVETVSPTSRTHPRFAVLDAERRRLEQEDRVSASRRRPTANLFGKAAYGRPGFDMFDDRLHGYGQIGLRLRWQPWDWRRTSAELEELDLRRRVLVTEEAAFRRRLERAVEAPLGRIAALEEMLQADDEIVALRESIEGRARTQYDERAITAADWIDRRVELQEARVARLRHRVELARVRAQYLTTLGAELR